MKLFLVLVGLFFSSQLVAVPECGETAAPLAIAPVDFGYLNHHEFYGRLGLGYTNIQRYCGSGSVYSLGLIKFVRKKWGVSLESAHGGGFSMFGRFGGMYIRDDQSEAFSIYGGAGIGVAHLLFGVEYFLPKSEEADVRAVFGLSLGVPLIPFWT